MRTVPTGFADRVDAGRWLAEEVDVLGGQDVVVLGLPRGGVPVAVPVADALGAPLDVLVVGKVGQPGHEELALGAVDDEGGTVLNPGVIAAAGLPGDEVAALARRRVAELAARADDLRSGRPAVPLAGRVAVVVDDGMATGATMRVAVGAARRRGARTVVAAVPVASAAAARQVAAVADGLACVLRPPGFRSVGPWYDDFTQVSDDEVRLALEAERIGRSPRPTRGDLAWKHQLDSSADR
ncbi:MAG TPA: phosphoribosyltransferase family protein [Acidimicrobiales bacterium]|nr:phosphoribosyltransferase family protein [Acidimicrobiales bacterium]